MPSLSGELMGLLGLLMAHVGGCRVWVTPKHCIIKKPQLSSVMSQESCTPALLTYPPRPRRYLLREQVEAQARLGVLPAPSVSPRPRCHLFCLCHYRGCGPGCSVASITTSAPRWPLSRYMGNISGPQLGGLCRWRDTREERGFLAGLGCCWVWLWGWGQGTVGAEEQTGRA